MEFKTYRLRFPLHRGLFLSMLFFTFLMLAVEALSQDSVTVVIRPLDFKGLSNADATFLEGHIYRRFTENSYFIVSAQNDYNELLAKISKENETCSDAGECYLLAAQEMGIRRIITVQILVENNTATLRAEVVNLNKSVLATYSGYCDADKETIAAKVDDMVVYFLQEFTGKGTEDIDEPGQVGTLEIRTEPAGAKVFLDGVARGVTPIRFERLEAIDHDLTLTLDGYLPYPGMVRIKSGESKEVEHLFQKQTGTLHVTSDPVGAIVYLDGENLGETELKQKKIPVGKYTLLVDLPRYEKVERQVTILFNQETSESFNLTPNLGKIQVLCNLDNLVIEVDGSDSGRTKVGEPVFIEAKSGGHVVVLRLDQRELFSGEVEVPLGSIALVAQMELSVTDVQDVQPGRVHKDGLVPMVEIPAGSFMMGSPETESGRDSDEVLHKVAISRPFLIGQYEVTQAQWKEIVGNNPSYFQNCGSDCPVEMVSWYEAVIFCNRLSEKEGFEKCYEVDECSGTLGGGCGDSDGGYCGGDYNCGDVRFKGLSCNGYRLPTESEWEYVVRSGSNSAIYTGELTIKGYRNGPALDSIAWYGGNSGVNYSGGFDCSGWKEKAYSSNHCGTHPIGKKTANQWNIYDVLGNVWEWTWDYYDEYPGDVTTDPVGPSTGSSRVFRGGGWNRFARFCRSANRYWDVPFIRVANLGFRLFRSL